MANPAQYLFTFYQSSIGKKIIVALTGAALVGFLVGHLAGNLLMYAGPEAFNTYAHQLKSMKALLWGARIGLLVFFVTHIVATIQLTLQNKAARPQAYAKHKAQVSGMASRTMIFSGLTVLAFVIFHLLHYTLGVNSPELMKATYNLHGTQVHHAYQMVITGFSSPAISGFYILSMFLLCTHLSHGIQSIFQTLGLVTHRLSPLFKGFSIFLSALLFIGFTSIPISVLFKWIA
jgi:succinate dehydrogenase / fumarate reductase cytochrome b subunit